VKNAASSVFARVKGVEIAEMEIERAWSDIHLEKRPSASPVRA